MFINIYILLSHDLHSTLYLYTCRFIFMVKRICFVYTYSSYYYTRGSWTKSWKKSRTCCDIYKDKSLVGRVACVRFNLYFCYMVFCCLLKMWKVFPRIFPHQNHIYICIPDYNKCSRFMSVNGSRIEEKLFVVHLFPGCCELCKSCVVIVVGYRFFFKLFGCSNLCIFLCRKDCIYVIIEFISFSVLYMLELDLGRVYVYMRSCWSLVLFL